MWPSVFQVRYAQILSRGFRRDANLHKRKIFPRTFTSKQIRHRSSSRKPYLQPFLKKNSSLLAVSGISAITAGCLYIINRNTGADEASSDKFDTISPVQLEKQLNEKLAAELVATEPKTGANWKRTLQDVVPAIVSLKLNNPKWFDTETPGNGSATGFIVDADKGIILTNRHVVGAGLVDAEAVFQNNEEVVVHAMYRDPVHDFGFFQYDPEDVKHIAVPSLPLRPDKASVGVDIRVVGNDAAEKLAIASGTLARLDREAPYYGSNSYNDFNTFYYQASSGTTGGSSGSPVLNQAGEVVALNAGGKVGTSASFYLPLDRVKRALELIQNGEPVSRGTIHTVFKYKPFDEVRRLGLRAETEALIRSTFPIEVGMLTVSEILPQGAAKDKLQPGDILIRINGQLITQFVPLETVLDDHVDKSINIEVERAGKVIQTSIDVHDLHAVTPSRFLEIGGAVINPLSYQQARNHAQIAGAPYVAHPGYFLQRAGIGRGSIIHAINGQETPNLNALRDCLANCEDGERIVVKYAQVASKSERVDVAHVDRRWFPSLEYNRDDALGTWHCHSIDREPPSSPIHSRQSVHGTTRVLPGKNAIEAKLAHSLVTVDFDRPFSANSLSISNYRGSGLVIDAEKGLVVVDRNTVADSIGDAMITFANTIKVPVQVLFVHPVHNFAILKYDPALFGASPIRSCEINEKRPEPSDQVWLVGLQGTSGHVSHSELVSRETIVSGVKWIGLPIPNPPRYQEHNLEMIALQDVVGTEGGVVCNVQGQVQALWASFAFQQRRGTTRVESQFTRGIPMDIIMKSAASLMEGKIPDLWDLGIDFEVVSLARARELGLDQDLTRALEQNAPDRRTALSVARRWGGTDAFDKLKNGDILVAVDGQIVTSFWEVERYSQKAQVTLTIVRDGEKTDLEVKPLSLEKTEVNRLIFWQGLLLQAPPLSVFAQRGISMEDGIYVSCQSAGSPAARYGPPPTTRIKQIDEYKTTTLDEFVTAVKATEGNSSVRTKYVDLSGKERLSTLKLKPAHWPTSELVYENGNWHRREI
uniref:Proapoptotic serine protease nma111like protein puta n=1 Tax=Albugo laibachii Nc14 TaxID=890382 RepID=F0W5T5_9STRA|nr:proapoptotic serine protease nma111like protein puta [Albugo laibachii Nc14]|eukprot:CCA16476.1 proapoptotic serine protease nma111like protein puta [Albugo laibachii Nc14]